MDEAVALLRRLAGRAARRLTWQRAVATGAVAGAAVLIGILAASAASLIILLDPVPPVLTVSALLGAVAIVSALVAWSRPVTPLAAARLLDLGARLDERCSTALEVAARGASGPLATRLITDAARRAEALDLRVAFPWRVPRAAAVIALLLGALLAWPAALRGVALPGTPAQRTLEAIRREGGRLERFARILQSQARAPRAPQTRRAADEIRELGERLHAERLARAEALARINEVARRIEEARRGLDARIEAPAPGERGAPGAGRLQRSALQQQIRQLRELTGRLQQESGAAPDVLQRLGEIARDGEGRQSARTGQRLAQAREQLARGDALGARQSLEQVLRDLEGLEAMLADREGLASAQRELERSREAIASAAGAQAGREDQPGAASQASPPAPGDRPPSLESEAAALPAEGPHEGTTPGQGRVLEKMGAPSPRLTTPRTPARVRGQQGEGPVIAGEAQGAGRRGAARTPAQAVTPAIVARADRAVAAARTPGRYRAIIRRYFEALAALR
jgi:hypothetical protein